MKVHDLTIPQIEYYRTFCNFDEMEDALFLLRSKNTSLERCAEVLHYDDIKRLSRRVNRKVLAVTDYERMNKWIENVYWKKIIQNQ